jgi:hypothetical protein
VDRGEIEMKRGRDGRNNVWNRDVGKRLESKERKGESSSSKKALIFLAEKSINKGFVDEGGNGSKGARRGESRR